MYAIIKTGGKQYSVAPGDEVKLEKLSGQAGDTVVFDNILLASDKNGVSVGKPLLENSKVTGTIVRHGRDKKVLVFKYKRRKGYRRKNGHRQAFSLVRIQDIQLPS
ncbi:MAG: 50S ribosomal protein L21 [Thermoplasmata archaeon]|nr:MAG: 50S ribosomal protein L21 [Deltaproteobacteria bacterium]RLF53583.1 MAG: 50S ribosomal protein L21 [Thermoplasmata archaeon]